MKTTEQALQAARGAVLPDLLAAETGRSATDTQTDLGMLAVYGKAEEVGGRWRWIGGSAATSTPTGKAKAVRGGSGKRVKASAKGAKVQTAKAKPGDVILKGKGFTARRGPARGTSAPYPVKVCSVRYKSPDNGRWVAKPKNAPAAGKLRKGRVIDGRLMVVKTVNDLGNGSEVTGARVILPEARAAQRKGRMSKAQLRDLEREMSRDALTSFNPTLADQVDRERMHAAHNSDKAKRGAVTRKKSAALKKHRPSASIQADAQKFQNQLDETARQLRGKVTPKKKALLSNRMKALTKKRAAVVKEAKAAGMKL